MRLSRDVVAGVIAAWVVLVAAVVFVLATVNTPQGAFPCHEDEVLGYKRGVQDRVVCMHVEEVGG